MNNDLQVGEFTVKDKVSHKKRNSFNPYTGKHSGYINNSRKTKKRQANDAPHLNITVGNVKKNQSVQHSNRVVGNVKRHKPRHQLNDSEHKVVEEMGEEMGEEMDVTTKSDEIEIVESSLDYNPFYQTKFQNNIKKKNVIHNSNALLLLSKIKSDPSTYISNKMIKNFIKDEPKTHTKLTKEEVDEQAKIARDFII